MKNIPYDVCKRSSGEIIWRDHPINNGLIHMIIRFIYFIYVLLVQMSEF